MKPQDNPNKKKDFIVVDFEFTQGGQRRNRPVGFFSEIVEFGAVRIDGSSHEVVRQEHCFVRPHFYPGQLKEIAELCMITEKEMRTAITFPDMIGRLKELYIPEKTYFVSWGAADLQILKKGCERHGIENPVLFDDYLDFAEWYRWEMGDSNITGLKKAIYEQDIDAGLIWHTACDDAANTGRLLIKLLKDGWKPDEFLNRL